MGHLNRERVPLIQRRGVAFLDFDFSARPAGEIGNEFRFFSRFTSQFRTGLVAAHRDCRKIAAKLLIGSGRQFRPLGFFVQRGKKSTRRTSKCRFAIVEQIAGGDFGLQHAVYHLDVDDIVVLSNVAIVPSLTSWMLASILDTAPPHGPPRPYTALRAPPLLSA